MSDELEKSPGVTNPLVLLQSMVDRGADPDALKKMMDLAERWEANQAKKAYQAAMNAAQGEMTGVLKDKANNHTKSAYAALESVQEMARPIYTKHGFSLSWGQEAPPKEGWLRFVATVRHVGGHCERFQGDYPQDGFGAKGGANMNAVQGVVSSGSYMQRDMLRLIFNITIAGADVDGNILGLRIVPDQVREINELLEECRELGKPVDFKRFLAWLGIDGLQELRQSYFAKAIHELNRKRREPAKGKKEATT